MELLAPAGSPEALTAALFGQLEFQLKNFG